MNRRTVAAVALALAVVLAGCGGSGQQDPGTESTPGDTPTATATPTPQPFQSMPPGVSEQGVTDREALLDAHASALDGTSVTVDVDFRLTVDGDGQNVALRGKVTPDDDRGWMQVETDDGVGTYYTESGTTYRTVTIDGETSHGTTDQVSAIPDSPRFGADSRARDALWNANWTFDGIVQRDGEHLLRYEATNVTLPSEVDVDRESAGATTSGTLLVDENGVIRHVEVSATVETDQRTVEYGVTVSFSAVGSTTIEAPDWLDQAKDG
ncbi:hypothetical protein BRC81_16075 [Halobacteriales archaeon QS_1_68_20]|nr:MAG: hypothetical protein BRC81_16075 [Halobacteriales archaeon QS_1_68_20]